MTDPIPDADEVRSDPAADVPSWWIGPVSLEPAGCPSVYVDPRMSAAHAAGRRELAAEMAAWHRAREAKWLASADLARNAGRTSASFKMYELADVHDASARHAKALAAAADDPAGPLPMRVRVWREGGIVALRVHIGPEHGAASVGSLVILAEHLDGVRAGWPGAAFVEERPHGAGS